MIVVKTKTENKFIKIKIFMNRNSFEILKKSFHFVKKKTINKIPKKTIQEIIQKDVNYANVSINLRIILRILQNFDQLARKNKIFVNAKF